MAHEYSVLDRQVRFEGGFFAVYSDEVAMPGGGSAERDYVRHKGAVAVLAVDDEERVVLVRQYRHGVRRHLWELPAGVRDAAGEAPEQTAVRELAEETDLTARTWSPFIQVHPSPGISDEFVQIFVARGLREVPVGQRYQRAEEEAEITVARFPVAEAVAMALRAEITNGVAMVAILAYQAERTAAR